MKINSENGVLPPQKRRWIDRPETKVFRQRDVREGETFARPRAIEPIGSCSARSESPNDGPFASRNVAGTHALDILGILRKHRLFVQLFCKQIETATKIN